MLSENIICYLEVQASHFITNVWRQGTKSSYMTSQIIPKNAKSHSEENLNEIVKFICFLVDVLRGRPIAGS